MAYITASTPAGVTITNTTSGHAVWYDWETLRAVGVTSIEDFDGPWNEHATMAEGLLMTIRPDRTLSNTYRKGGQCNASF